MNDGGLVGCLQILSLAPLCFVSSMPAIRAAAPAPVAYVVGLAAEDAEGCAPASCRRVDVLSVYDGCYGDAVGR